MQPKFSISSTTKEKWILRLALANAMIIALCVEGAGQNLPTTNGKKGLEDAAKEVTGYFTAGTNVMYAVGAIVGIVGAVKVYQKWNQGDQDTGKVAAAWFGSCIFLIVVTAVLKGFYGVG